MSWRQAGKKRLVTATSQGRNGKRHVISETQFVPGEENDDESDLGEPMQLVADNGDASADGEDIQDAAETMGGGEDLVSADSGDDLLG